MQSCIIITFGNYVTKITLELREEVTLDLRQETMQMGTKNT